MNLTEQALRAVYALASRFVYGSAANEDWIYEKVRRPRHVPILFANLLSFYLRRPRVTAIVTIVLEPVCGCNLRCTYCRRAYAEIEGRRPRFMKWDLFRKAVDQAPATVETITLACVGEPLLHAQFPEMIGYIAAHGKRAVLYTNGTLLTGDRLTHLAQSPLSTLCVSVEPDPETSEKYRGADLAAIRRNVEAFVAAKRPETEVTLSLVAHEGNQGRLAEVSQSWAGLIDGVKVGPCVSFDGPPKAHRCFEPWRGNLTILTSGEVTPCCLDEFPDLAIGNLNTEDLDTIIHGPAFRNMLERMLRGEAPGHCRRCCEFHAPGVAPKAAKREIAGSKHT